MPQPLIKLALGDLSSETGVGLLFADGKPIGHYKKAQYGPGFFVHVDGKRWATAEGARYHQERDATYPYAYAPTKKAIHLRVVQAMETDGVLRNKR